MEISPTLSSVGQKRMLKEHNNCGTTEDEGKNRKKGNRANNENGKTARQCA